ncbi:MAG: hypothetical protein B7Y43_17390 [Sphingomonas sp. 28-62-20]|uniref:hypothetical protein n=1 Tax=Sphingomonas sp. 28-62-20 TaxID=1970433 RepID=UPI000BCC313F|nr:MAG: hypothetical protein B7Y43_17390 [Sphingomonas sp. 28-62-20]
MMNLQVARIIANYVLFLYMTDDNTLNPDAAVQQMEELANDMEALDKDLLRGLIDAFAVIAPEYSDEAQLTVRNIAHDFYLEEAVAADDPARLAELEALRDAEEG